jgi:uncharacterized membrane protein
MYKERRRIGMHISSRIGGSENGVLFCGWNFCFCQKMYTQAIQVLLLKVVRWSALVIDTRQHISSVGVAICT